MKPLEYWSLLVGLCLSCCGKVSNDGDPAGGAGRGNADAAGSGGRGGFGSINVASGGVASGSAGFTTGGPAGAGGTPSGGSGGQGGFGIGGASGNVATGGSAGFAAGGGAGVGPAVPCVNDVVAVNSFATCATFGPQPAPSGGPLLVGTYYLVSYEVSDCFDDWQQTLRISQATATTYLVESVSTRDGRSYQSNVSFALDGNTFTSTSLCGTLGHPTSWNYSLHEDGGSTFLHVEDGMGAFTYQWSPN